MAFEIAPVPRPGFVAGAVVDRLPRRLHGPLARSAMRRAGIAAYASVRETPERRAVTIGVLTPFLALDLRGVYEELNRLEGCGALHRWGGSQTTFGGSPRAAGTSLRVATSLAVLARARRAGDLLSRQA